MPRRTSTRETTALYPEAFLTELADPAIRDSDPLLMWLCTAADASALRARDAMQTWYSRVPWSRAKESLRGDLRNAHPDGSAFYAALYELAFHEYFHQQGWDPTFHPRVNGKTPDLLVHPPGTGQAAYCEVVSIHDIYDLREGDRALDDLDRAIRTEVGADFDVETEYLDFPPPNLDQRSILDRVRLWAQGLARAEGARASLPINAPGLRAEVRAVWRDPANPGPADPKISFRPTIACDWQIARLREKIETKANRYLGCGDTLVVAVGDNMSYAGIDPESVVTALYGTTRWALSSGAPGQKAELDPFWSPDGFFFDFDGPAKRFKRCHVSGVLVGRIEWGDTSPAFRLRAYHNPTATVRLDYGLFAEIPQFGVVLESADPCRLDWIGEELGAVALTVGTS